MQVDKLNEHQLQELTDSLKALGFAIHMDNVERGFWPEDKQSRNKGETLMLVVTELVEAFEAVRKKEQEKDKHLPHRDAFEVEIADTIVRLLDLGEGFNIDYAGALKDKVLYNRTRPYKHGKKF